MADFLQNRFVTLWQFIEVFKLLRWGNTLFVKLLKEKGLSLIFCTTKIIQIFLFYCVFLPDCASESFAGLKWSDIDFQNGTVSVCRTVQRINKHGKSEVAIGSPKSKSSVRIVPIPDFLLAILKAKGKGDDFYIITGTSKPTEPRTMRIVLSQYWKPAVYEMWIFICFDIPMQLFALKTGFDPKTLSELLGHADASITLNRYVHSSMQMKKNYVSRLQLTA